MAVLRRLGPGLLLGLGPFSLGPFAGLLGREVGVGVEKGGERGVEEGVGEVEE